MKFAAVIIAVLSLSLFAQAQQNLPAVKDKKVPGNNELGVFTDFNIGSASQSINMLGVQYKHWKNNIMAYRISLGSGKYYDQGTELFLPSGNLDTVYSRRVNYELPMAFLAIGAEVQKAFYRKLFFYGALELKGGYGRGRYDSVYLKRSVYNNGGYVDASNRSTTGSAYYAALSPAFGLKLNFRRLVIGTEFTSLMQFVSKEAYRGRDGNFSFDLSSLNQRIFINYRFR